MKKLSLTELKRKSIEEFKDSEKMEIIVILDNIRSLHNVGSIFRTCDAFLIQKLYLCGITGTPPNREILKTAIGATETVDWQYVEKIDTILPILKTENYSIVAIEQTSNSIPLDEFEPASKIVLILGNEVEGVSEIALQFCDFAVEIPQFGMKHSLNVTIAGGICLFEISKKMRQNKYL